MRGYFRVDVDFHRHKKIIGLSSDQVRWTHMLVWAEGKVQRPQGFWNSLQHLAGCVPGRPLKHLRELVAAGLLDTADNGSITVHDWSDWQSGCPADPTSPIRSQRYRDRSRHGADTVPVTAESRLRNGEITDGITPPSRSRHGADTVPVTPPSRLPSRSRHGDDTPARHGQTETDTETETESRNSEGAEPPGADVFAPPPTGMEFPLKGGGAWIMPEELVRDLARAYPTLDLLQEATRLKGWLKVNSGKRKTARGMPRCVLAWMSQEIHWPQGRPRRGPQRQIDQSGLDSLQRWALKEGIEGDEDGEQGGDPEVSEAGAGATNREPIVPVAG